MKRLMLLATMCCAFGASAYTLDNGVLTLTLPKKQSKPVEKQSMQIE